MKPLFLPMALGLFVALPARTLANPPNVVMIISDDQRWTDFGFMGHPTIQTPHLDRLHGQSIRLTDYHVAPMCTPTRGQLLTGIDAARKLEDRLMMELAGSPENIEAVTAFMQKREPDFKQFRKKE